jgi:hypothetical protein
MRCPFIVLTSHLLPRGYATLAPAVTAMFPAGW